MFTSARSLSKRLVCYDSSDGRVDNCVYAGLAALARKLAADFMAIDRVHDDDIIGAVVAEECRFYDFLPRAR